MRQSLVVLFFILLALSQCGMPDHLSEKELLKYVNDPDNGLMKEKQIQGVEVKVSYRPTDILVVQELRNNKQPDQETVLKVRKKYQGHYYFIVNLSKDKKEILTPNNLGLPGFSDMIQTVSFQMSSKVNLTTPMRDTIMVADYIYNRTFGMGQSTDILFVFDKKKAKGQNYVQFNLDEFGLGIGKQSFQFETSLLESAPKIFKP